MTNHKPERIKPVRIGVLLGKLGKRNAVALKYLILHINTLQTSLEFEIFEADKNDLLVNRMRRRKKISSEYLKAELSDFKKRTNDKISDDAHKFELVETEPPNGIILLTMAKLSDKYHARSELGVGVLALGRWKRSMAPPSLVEAFITLTLRQAVGIISPSLNRSRHLGTRACLFDFAQKLEDTRFKTLHGFICNDCRAALGADGYDRLGEDVSRVSDTRQWLGKPEDPTSPASIVAKLGYDLFLTKGVTPTFWESARAALRSDGVQGFIKLLYALLLAYLLFRLGWHTAVAS